MKYTLAELFQEVLKRNNMAALVGQKAGKVNWMWMGGENNSSTCKGEFCINNLYSMRKAIKEIRNAEIHVYVEVKPVPIQTRLNLLARKYYEKSYFRTTNRSGNFVFKISTAPGFTG